MLRGPPEHSAIGNLLRDILDQHSATLLVPSELLPAPQPVVQSWLLGRGELLASCSSLHHQPVWQLHLEQPLGPEQLSPGH